MIVALAVLAAFLMIVIVALYMAVSESRHKRALRDDWRARTATLEGAGSHLSTRPD